MHLKKDGNKIGNVYEVAIEFHPVLFSNYYSFYAVELKCFSNEKLESERPIANMKGERGKKGNVKRK